MQQQEQKAPEVQMTADEQAAFEKYLAETKRALKGYSKNDLIRMCAALLVDKHAMLGMIQNLQAKSEVASAEVTSV